MKGKIWHCIVTTSLAGTMWTCSDERPAAPAPIVCGDGLVDSGEECDDGNGVITDACPDGPSGTCMKAWCGDGFIGPDESCDDGPLNSDSTPGSCRVDCTLPACGDGVVDLDEGCDDGNGVLTDACPDGPTGTCETATCGDGFVAPAEDCDDGAGEGGNSDTTPDACRTDCRLPWCGDGVVDTGEGCDDGNLSVIDACPDGVEGSCEPAWCGDGFARMDIVDSNSLAYEECDEGGANSDSAPNACRLDCRAPWCGDDVLDAGEECDGGPFNSDTEPNRCRTSCRRPYCGDGVVDTNDRCNLNPRNSVSYPVRIAEGPGKQFYVTDADKEAVFIYDTGTDGSLKLVGEIQGVSLPLGVAVSPSGRLYVGSDGDDHIAVFDIGGERLASIGAGQLRKPNDIDLDADGNLYVADSALHRVVVFTPDGAHLRDIGIPNNDNGTLQLDELAYPVAIDVAYRSGQPGEVYVADRTSEGSTPVMRIVVFNLQGVALRTFGDFRQYISDYQGKFRALQGIGVDVCGNVHAIDSEKGFIQILDAVTGAFVGEYASDPPGEGSGQLRLPLDLVVSSDNRVVVTNALHSRVEVVTTSTTPCP